jgi:hypothetical protein
MNIKLFLSFLVFFSASSHEHVDKYYTNKDFKTLYKIEEKKESSLIQKRVERAIEIAVFIFFLVQLYRTDWKLFLENMPKSMKDLANLHIFKHTETPYIKITSF